MKEQYWYLRSIKEVLDELHATKHGLREAEVSKRLEQYGENILEQEASFQPVKVLFEKMNSLLVYILLATGIISLLAGHPLEFYIILLILGFTVFVSFIQEYQAAQSVQALQKFVAKTVTVIREDKQQEISASQLVPGDIVEISAGMIIPADMRVLESTGLRVDESILTGESVLKNKVEKRIDAQDVDLADQHNMLFSGSSVSVGSGRGIVVSTGSESAIGKISRAIKEIGYQKTPLQKKVEVMTQRISVAVIIVACILFLVLMSRSEPLLASLILVGAIIVAGIPESFPLVLTIALTRGVRRMAKQQAVVKDMSSVETLGTTTVICTDKTGTLTQNRMRVSALYFPKDAYVDVSGSGYEPRAEFMHKEKTFSKKRLSAHKQFFEASVFCNNAHTINDDGQWVLQGDPTEGALLTAAKAYGCDDEVLREDNPREHEVPFDSEKKYMITIHNKTAYLKGGVEQVIEKCSYVREKSAKKKLTNAKKQRIIDRCKDMSESQLRLLAVATKPNAKPSSLGSGFILEGVAGIEDPVRPEAKQAVLECQQAGIRVMMITGDHVSTAKSIAQQVGLLTENRSNVMTGNELDKLSDKELDKQIEHISVFARTTPDHKLRIVNSLQRQGEIVAMTGDGVNDAPALKKADLGVSMGKNGTEVARQASNLVLADDNFATIVHAVEQGRTIHSNIRRFTFYLLTGNITEVSLMLLALFIGLSAPLTALMILFINLVTSSLPALALAIEPTHKKVMSHLPRDPKERLLSNYIITKILTVVPIILISGFGVFWYYLEYLSLGVEYASTMVFVTIIVSEMFHIFNARSLHTSVFSKSLFGNKYVYVAMFASMLLTLLTVYLPVANVAFGTIALSGADWVLATALGSLVLIISEISKLMIRSEVQEQNALQGASLQI